MSYKIEKQTDKKDFIVEYNHNQGLVIQDGAELVEGVYTEFTYALLPNELMTEEQVDIEVDVPDFETKIEEYEEPIFDENGEIIGYNTIQQEVQVPIMIKFEEVILVPIFDEEGNFIGEEEQTVTREVQATHKEMRTVTLRYPVINPNYEAEQAQKEKERIAKLFLTGADVERGIYQAIGKDFEDIIELVETLIFAEAPQVANIDLKALKIELKANHFYRGNPYVNAVGALLGFTSEQLDKFFMDGNYEHLLALSVDDIIVTENNTEVKND